MTAYLSSPLTWTLATLLGAIAYIVVITYRDALRERRERRKRQAQEDAALVAKLRSAPRPWEGDQK